jgi:hypothetical protein
MPKYLRELSNTLPAYLWQIKVSKRRPVNKIGHVRDCSRTQRFHEGELLPVVPLFEKILLQMPIRREIDGGKRYITEQTGTGTFIEPQDT